LSNNLSTTAEADYYADWAERLWNYAGVIDYGTKALGGYLTYRAVKKANETMAYQWPYTRRSRVATVPAKVIVRRPPWPAWRTFSAARGRGAMGKRTVRRTRGFWDPASSRSLFSANQKIADPITSTAYEATTTGSVILLNGIASGDDYNQRDGRRVILDSISIKGDMFYSSATAAHNVDIVRMMLIYDKQTNGAAPAIADVLVNANADSHYNVNNLGRFDVLIDKTWSLPQVPAATASAVTFPKIKLGRSIKRGTQYSGTGSSVASIASGGLYLILIGSQAFSGTNNSIIELSVRLFFHG